jgi:hypothetical protein
VLGFEASQWIGIFAPVTAPSEIIEKLNVQAGADGYMHRRVYTDGRDWAADFEPSRIGYSIGRPLSNAKSSW